MLRGSSLSLILFFLYSCAVVPPPQEKAKNISSRRLFRFSDTTGQYIIERDLIIKNKTLATKMLLYKSSEKNTPLEKTYAVSKIGGVKGKNGNHTVLRPEVSQFFIWYEKKKYFSQLKLDLKKKGMSVIMDSPEKKWQGQKLVKLPKGLHFCFFSQIPECLKVSGMLNIGPEIKPYSFVTIWDSYPYHQEQYNVSNKLFSSSEVVFDKKQKNEYHFIVRIDDKMLFYQFDLNFNFKNMYWISEGISLESVASAGSQK